MNNNTQLHRTGGPVGDGWNGICCGELAHVYQESDTMRTNDTHDHWVEH